MDNYLRDETTEDRQIREEMQREYARDYTDPEKHFVRKHVWEAAAIDRLSKVQNREERRIKYFTLCAEKAIDVLYFDKKNIIENYNGVSYPSVTFCESHPDKYEMIAATLGRTRGFLARFEDLVLERGNELSQEFYKLLPFDIYNLDFTSMCFPRREPPFSRTLDAIVTLIEEMGRSYHQHGFDMFFTFRAQRSNDNEEAIQDLRKNLIENTQTFAWYNEIFRRIHGDIGLMLQRKYHQFLLCALPKLIGKFGRDFGFRVTYPNGLYYPRPTVQNPNFYIISFVITFDWAGGNLDIRRAVRQSVRGRELARSSYLDMIRATVERNTPNVGATRFAREQYKEEVRTLLLLTDNP